MDSAREKMAMYFKNSHNKLQLIDEDNHVYTRHSGQDGPGKRVYWLCEHPRCKRIAIVEDDEIIHTPEHRHPSNKLRLEARLCELRAIEKAGENLTIKPSEIIDELKRLHISVRQFLKPRESILRRIRKKRAAVRKAAKAVVHQTQPDVSDVSSPV